MQDQQQPQRSFTQEMALTTNAFIGLCQLVCMILYPILRVPGSWGYRFASFRMMFSWILLFLWPCFFTHEDPRPVWWLFITATVFLLIHRIAGVIRRARGRECHSLYPGDSWLRNVMFDLILLVVVAYFVMPYNRPLGTYLLVSAGCMWISEAWQYAAHQAKRRAMLDAQFEAQDMMQ